MRKYIVLIFIVAMTGFVIIEPGYGDEGLIFVQTDSTTGYKFMKISDMFLGTVTVQASENCFAVTILDKTKYNQYIQLYSSLSYIKSVNNMSTHTSNKSDSKQVLILRVNGDETTVKILALIYEFELLSSIPELNAYLIGIPGNTDIPTYISLLKLSPYILSVEANNTRYMMKKQQ